MESAQIKYGRYLVEGVLFTPPNKLALASRLRESFEDQTVRIPQGDQDLRDDLHSLKRVQSPTGAPRFVAENTDAGHADRAWALALALHAASTPYQPYAYHPVSLRLEERLPTPNGGRFAPRADGAPDLHLPDPRGGSDGWPRRSIWENHPTGESA